MTSDADYPRTTRGAFQESRSAELSEDDVAALVRVLDLQQLSPAVQRLRDWSLDRLELGDGESAVDVGCGTGSEVRRIALRVGDSGRATGVDANPRLLEVAAERTPSHSSARWSLASASDLPFADDSVDALRCERVFQHLEDPQAAADEIARVLRPGGRAVVVDSDWGTFVTVTDEPEIMRRVQEWGWRTQWPNPFAGRHLRAQLRSAGLEVDDDIGSSALVLPPEALLGGGPLGRTVESAQDEGVVTADEAARLVSGIEASAQRGDDFVAVTMFAVVARRPG